jgi:hypothetical protein
MQGCSGGSAVHGGTAVHFGCCPSFKDNDVTHRPHLIGFNKNSVEEYGPQSCNTV